ncbi:MAG: hypothetical protein ACOC7K_02305 [bacterium]
MGLIEATTDVEVDVWETLEGSWYDWILAPLSSANIALSANPDFQIKVTADSRCEDGTPIIENENHVLIGWTSGGVDVTLFNVGYRLSWDVKIASVSSESEAITGDNDCKILKKTYTYDLVLEWDYAFVFVASGTQDLDDRKLTLQQECCCEE